MAPQRTSDRRKEDIVDVAARLFATRGYDAVGIDEIGAAAGITGPTVYWHFAGKEALLEAVALAGAERRAVALEAVGPEPTFADVARVEVGVALDHPDLTTTLLHDAHHLTGRAARRVRAVEARTDAVARPALLRADPALRRSRDGAAADADLRLAVRVGPLLTVATDRHGVVRHRVEAIAVAAITALATAAPGRPGRPGRHRGVDRGPVGQVEVDGDRPPAGGPDRPGRPPARSPWEPARTRRDGIVHTARALVRAHGYHAVGIGEIAAAAGISRPAIYHHFPGKAAILRAAWEPAGIRLVAAALDALDAATSAPDALDRLARACVPVVLDNVDLVRVLAGDLRHDPEPDRRDSWPANRRLLLDAWLAVLAEVHPDRGEPELRLLVEMAFGAAVHAALAADGDAVRTGEVAAVVAAVASAGVDADADAGSPPPRR